MNKRFLFLVPARLGDALMITPALALLKQLQVNCTVDILAVSSLGASVYRNNPHCNHIFVASEIQDAVEFVQSYDVLIAAHRDYKILELTERFKRPTVLIEPANQQQSQAQQALNFIQRVFSIHYQDADALEYQLYPTNKDQEFVEDLLHDDKKYIGLHLGCHGINKRTSLLLWRNKTDHKKIWPLKNFIQLAKHLKQHHPGYCIVLTGGENELHLANQFKKYMPDAINLVGKTNVSQLAALMQKLLVYVCSDTGVMHVACAMNIPVVALFGPTNLIRTGPYPKADFRHVLQTDNLAALNPEVVIDSINNFLI